MAGEVGQGQLGADVEGCPGAEGSAVTGHPGADLPPGGTGHLERSTARREGTLAFLLAIGCPGVIGHPEPTCHL